MTNLADLSPTKPKRIASVDTLRGLTILTMVFVNDVGPAAPAWAQHIQPPEADGMTVADVVFPAFLFIVGMSIPLAFESARQRGVGLAKQLGNILVRTVGLLLMGVILMNDAHDVALPKNLWGLLAAVSILLAWCVVPRSEGRRRVVFMTLKSLGAFILIALLVTYRREPVATSTAFRGDVADWVWLQTGWWGILGLIGWAYLVCSLIYLLLGTRREWLMGAIALLIGLNLSTKYPGGFFGHLEGKSWLDGIRPLIDEFEAIFSAASQYLDIGGMLGSHAAVALSGCLLGTILLPNQGLSSHRERLRWAILFALGLFIAGCFTDTFAGINKIAATPTWCLWSTALAVLGWSMLYLIMDVRGLTRWSEFIQPVGANPLIAYLLHPIVLWSLSLGGFSNVLAYKASDSSLVVMFGSLLMALIIGGLTALIARLGLRIRL